ncbi:MAG: carbamate kinase [Aeriscardovia sp.]|nr:carbamate kinase [Aeriscardovia sp.]
MAKRIVVALGGNAIVTKTGTAASQQESIKKTMTALAEFIKAGDELVITHGNGPQVGNLLLQQAAGSTEKNPAMPLDTVGAMTQGEIGFWMENALDAVLIENNISKLVATVVSQTVVAADDPRFANPSKPIGPFYTKEEAEAIKSENPDFTLIEDAGRGYRRVVPSPKPIDIVEASIVETLLKNNMVPIACGGGGVPVIKTDNGYKGVEAVIDKDFSAAKLAEKVHADELIILTAVDNACINFNTPEQRALGEVKVDEMQSYIEEGQFAAGSMLPKVQAAISFVENHPEGRAIITSLDKVSDLVAGKPGVGTIITK